MKFMFAGCCILFIAIFFFFLCDGNRMFCSYIYAWMRRMGMWWAEPVQWTVKIVHVARRHFVWPSNRCRQSAHRHNQAHGVAQWRNMSSGDVSWTHRCTTSLNCNQFAQQNMLIAVFNSMLRFTVLSSSMACSNGSRLAKWTHIWATLSTYLSISLSYSLVSQP